MAVYQVQQLLSPVTSGCQNIGLQAQDILQNRAVKVYVWSYWRFIVQDLRLCQSIARKKIVPKVPFFFWSIIINSNTPPRKTWLFHCFTSDWASNYMPPTFLWGRESCFDCREDYKVRRDFCRPWESAPASATWGNTAWAVIMGCEMSSQTLTCTAVWPPAFKKNTHH